MDSLNGFKPHHQRIYFPIREFKFLVKYTYDEMINRTFVKPHFDLNTRSSNKQNSMIYTDLIKLVGQYMTYSEFKRENPEIDLTEKDWYSICEGKTMRNNKKKLKQRYLDDFNDDWSSRRRIAFGLIDHEQETST